ncbi:unnamed protein product [Linum tenue]|uniref:Uncharacterized protein n=1 Tax=Linum tenue TaxID=586396 RepID=A0AAV0GYQ2_9ROSI|nr:unnamed protein product [Linum tenue]
MELTACSFYGGREDDEEEQGDATTTTTCNSATVHVSFANFPSLKCLKLLRCRWSGRVKVSAPQVLDLEIWNPSSCFEIGKLSAPKVESFAFSGYVPRRYLDDDDGEISYGLPSLDRASLRLVWEEPGRCDGRKKERLARAFVAFLRCVRNATSLDLRFDRVPLRKSDGAVETIRCSAWTNQAVGE